jgi:hypothetical protein
MSPSLVSEDDVALQSDQLVGELAEALEARLVIASFNDCALPFNVSASSA